VIDKSYSPGKPGPQGSVQRRREAGALFRRVELRPGVLPALVVGPGTAEDVLSNEKYYPRIMTA